MKRTPLLVAFLILVLGSGTVDSTCTTRRCLAQMLIDMEMLSMPQDENCTLPIYVPFIEYQTLSVNTKSLRLNSRLRAIVKWTDPQLAWDTSVYPYDAVMLPVDKIWTPVLQVKNGISTNMKHDANDLLVYSNGTVNHEVQINAEINCEVNLFNYPFAGDECPVAIETFSSGECVTTLILDQVRSLDGSTGDWQTTYARLKKQREDRNFIAVGLKINYSSPLMTLLLPTVLIVLADFVSFALPLHGGGRNGFKVTLVLSFVMFLNLLNSQLPGNGDCSPIIRIHFCICLVLLVLSMLVSMVLTRLAHDGSLAFFSPSKRQAPQNTKDNEKKDEEELKADIHVVLPDGPEDVQMLRKVVTFLQRLDDQKNQNERKHAFADKLDKIFFLFYVILGLIYMCVMLGIMVAYKCEIDHFNFWY
ncbi:ligand-gated cation channel ZACN-like [Oryzias latipes]|uniref:ZAC n=1 Tax=Oryzias latipes TaxID=8090 RepID=A0ABF7PQ38_ORYLA